jgi:hypothetical protein
MWWLREMRPDITTNHPAGRTNRPINKSPKHSLIGHHSHFDDEQKTSRAGTKPTKKKSKTPGDNHQPSKEQQK